MGERAVRYYTQPPNGVEWKYLFVNPRTYRLLFKRDFEHAILDCGVQYFHDNPNVNDYPPGFLNYWKKLAVYLSSIFKEKLWVTIPDYPDDYHPGQFGDNVERTLRNIKDFVKIEGVNWLPVIQSRFLDKDSFRESCKKLKGLIGDYPRVAIGTVCKARNLDFIEYCCRTARRFFPNSWIHAFGLTLSSLPYVLKYIDSFDSTAYTFPRVRGHSAKNAKERVEYFKAYLNKVVTITSRKQNNRNMREVVESC